MSELVATVWIFNTITQIDAPLEDIYDFPKGDFFRSFREHVTALWATNTLDIIGFL